MLSGSTSPPFLHKKSYYSTSPWSGTEEDKYSVPPQFPYAVFIMIRLSYPTTFFFTASSGCLLCCCTMFNNMMYNNSSVNSSITDNKWSDHLIIPVICDHITHHAPCHTSQHVSDNQTSESCQLRAELLHLSHATYCCCGIGQTWTEIGRVLQAR